jgi:hypothetical protein
MPPDLGGWHDLRAIAAALGYWLDVSPLSLFPALVPILWVRPPSDASTLPGMWHDSRKEMTGSSTSDAQSMHFNNSPALRRQDTKKILLCVFVSSRLCAFRLAQRRKETKTQRKTKNPTTSRAGQQSPSLYSRVGMVWLEVHQLYNAPPCDFSIPLFF